MSRAHVLTWGLVNTQMIEWHSYLVVQFYETPTQYGGKQYFMGCVRVRYSTHTQSRYEKRISNISVITVTNVSNQGWPVGNFGCTHAVILWHSQSPALSHGLSLGVHIHLCHSLEEEGREGGLAQICRKPLRRKVSQLYIIDTKNRFVQKEFNEPDAFRSRDEDVA